MKNKFGVDVVQELVDFFQEDRHIVEDKLRHSYAMYIESFNNFNRFDQMSDFEKWYHRTSLWYSSSEAQIYEQTYFRYFLTPIYYIDDVIKYYKGDVLDFGCGIGRFSLRALMLWKCKSVSFLDVPGITLLFLSYILKRRKVETAEIVYAPKKKYDLITLFDVLEHLDDPVGIVKSLHDFLKPGGKVIGCAPFFDLASPSHISKHINLSFDSVMKEAGYKDDEFHELKLRIGNPVGTEGEY